MSAVGKMHAAGKMRVVGETSAVVKMHAAGEVTCL